jgi:integrase/recombinase XerD
MASYKIILFTGKTYKDGKHPIALQVIHNRKRKIITLGLSSKPEDWISGIQRFSNESKNYKKNNQTLNFYEERIEQVISEIRKEGKTFSFELFSSKFLDKKETKSLYNMYKIVIKELRNAEKVNTLDIYQTSLNLLKKFTNNKDISFYAIDYNFLKSFESFLLKRGNSGGGIHHHMRTLRAITNEAIRRKYLEAEYYPFSTQFNKEGYSLSHLKSQAAPRALSEKDMESFKKFNIAKYPDFVNSYNYFMFSYYARGINFVDMAQIKWTDIYDQRLIYNRSKTGKPLNIRISENLQNIIDKYKNSTNEYIFPILNEIHITELQKKDRVKKCLKACNSDLKSIAKILKININLTTYVARHTYATTLKRKGFSTEVISEALGHSEIATTKAYLEKFSNDVLDNADEVL